MRISLPSPKRKARIEIIPLIDIVFFLLATFVMVSLSMVKNSGVPVNLPLAVTSVTEQRKAVVTVSVTESGDIYLDKEKLSISETMKRLETMKQSDADVKVLINGDEKAYFGQAIEILDGVRSLGIQKVTIQTKSKK